MTQTIFIKPANGAKVRDPVTKQHLKAEGERKPRSSYWLRRIASGEVIQAAQPAAHKHAQKTGE